jgi:hypothetical protein
MIVERLFENKPSIVTIKSNIRKAITNGADFIILRWGENQIDIERSAYGYWMGRGWIGRNSGQDIANEINRKGN